MERDAGTATERINSALATLKRDMDDLRQQDVLLMKQLININDTIQQLSKQRPCPHKPAKKKLALVNGRRSFINSDHELIPDTAPLIRQQSLPLYCNMDGNLSGSFSSIEDSSMCSVEDVHSVESESDDSFCGSEINLSDSLPAVLLHSRLITIDTKKDHSYEEIFRRNIKLWKFSRSQSVVI